MKMDNINLNQLWAELIVDELVRHGITYFCIAPGSRSTPLVAAAARHQGVQTMVACDERSLGFHALGYARAAAKPAAVITTSGTAVANLYPAVVEASSDSVPMVILTADRPPELMDCGANQTICQNQLFGSFVRWHTDLPCPDSRISPAMALTTVDQAVYRSLFARPGPVHLNCRFREPLEPVGGSMPEAYIQPIQRWQASRRPLTSYAMPRQILAEDEIARLAQLIDTIKRGMIVAGGLTSHSQRQAVLDLAGRMQWPVYADISSGLRFAGLPTHPIRYYDQALLSERFNQQAKPELVLHFGSHVTSKRLWQYFDQNRPERYIVIKPTSERYDPAHYVTDHLQTDIADFCQKVAAAITPGSSAAFAEFFQSRAALAQAAIAECIDGDDSLTEPFVSRMVSDIISESSGLFLSNSMPVRDMDLYAKSIHKPIVVGTNRGVSGIDGILSTATGFAAGLRKKVTLIIGDMAMFHDLNALSLLHKIQVPMVIIVINNRGGGIFDFLPISQHIDVFEPYFVAPHQFGFKGVCETFKVPYVRADNKAMFVEHYRQAAAGGLTTLIEVVTNRQDNLKLRKQIKNRILQGLQQIP